MTQKLMFRVSILLFFPLLPPFLPLLLTAIMEIVFTLKSMCMPVYNFILNSESGLGFSLMVGPLWKEHASAASLVHQFELHAGKHQAWVERLQRPDSKEQELQVLEYPGCSTYGGLPQDPVMSLHPDIVAWSTQAKSVKPCKEYLKTSYSDRAADCWEAGEKISSGGC